MLIQGKTKTRRVKTIYDCQADNDDELTFMEGEVIIVTGEEDQEWWVSTLLTNPLTTANAATGMLLGSPTSSTLCLIHA